MIVMANSLEKMNGYQDMTPYDGQKRFVLFVIFNKTYNYLIEVIG